MLAAGFEPFFYEIFVRLKSIWIDWSKSASELLPFVNFLAHFLFVFHINHHYQIEPSANAKTLSQVSMTI